MIKKLLKLIFNVFSSDRKKKLIENYLSKSSEIYDLENRIRELDKKGEFNKIYY